MMRALFPLIISAIFFSNCNKKETLELPYNPIDDPDFEFIKFDKVVIDVPGLWKDFHVNFIVKTDSVSAAQADQIIGFTLYENGEERFNMDKSQRAFYKIGIKQGTQYVWQIATKTLHGAGPKTKEFVYKVP